MSSSKLQPCLELCRFTYVLLKIKVARWKAHFLVDINKRPRASFIRTDAILLEVHNRKEECRAWCLIATTSQFLALSQLLLKTLMNVSLSWFVLIPYFTTYYCLRIFQSQPNTLLEPCLSSIPIIVVSPVPSWIPLGALIALVNHQGHSNTKIVLSILRHVSMISHVTSCIHPVLSSKRMSSSIAPMIDPIWNLRVLFFILSVRSSWWTKKIE
jgi:hypothetical protein